ncbi:zinc transport system ATP-binding protein [Mobilisporobacter senegalensis]|uniref:Zinc transport system ATP-binding protein n=1 Tax=Mobilisporobacter senegalensis TaxID=1329262 RepID=A0A3N1XUL1_9FIRM|nr:metal ABC transporter ATP-binding protein [Mobilisporobacter senegalensis]ROR28587.1 zinc transport system ATP-binding protein [Mobilisporobacter senegalensis]
MEKTKFSRGQKTLVQAKITPALACGLHCIKIIDYGVKIGTTTILHNVNLHIHCGKLTAIIGRNGAGKSTLMKAILEELPHEGRIEFKNMKSQRSEKLRIGYVPQNINIAKNTPTSVYDLFASFISNSPVFLFKKKRLYRIVKEQLKMFEASDLIDKSVCDLSGGELQRVLLSIAAMPIPNLLLLDEPISGVDRNGMELFYTTIDHLKKNYDLAVLLVSHDLDYVAKYADHVVLLDGTIIKEGTQKEVYESEEFKKVFGNVLLMNS